MSKKLAGFEPLMSIPTGNEGSNIIDSRHPSYNSVLMDKYRLTYSNSEMFKMRYLRKRHDEDDGAWNDRQALCYNPAFAREAIDEFARALIQRSADISRIGGHELFRAQCRGLYGGVDRENSSMNAFFAAQVIPELLPMGSVGVYVDYNRISGATLAHVDKSLPYLYTYRAEDILNWVIRKNSSSVLEAVLLRDYVEELDDKTKLPIGIVAQYRHLYLTPNGLRVDIYDDEGNAIETFESGMQQIPFTIISLPWSLMRDTADYQITLLNLTSADAYYAWAANFPLYTQQFDPYDPRNTQEVKTRDDENEEIGSEDPSIKYNRRRVAIGTTTGVEYPMGSERPAWIHPSPEPLNASIKKEEQLKEEIRQLTALAITALSLKMASAESKRKDREGLESGLSTIGLTLQSAENRISSIWHAYKNKDMNPTQIFYPEKYELKTEEDRRANAKELKDLQHAVPSRIFQKQVAKQIAQVMHGHRVTETELNKIFTEIDASPVPTADPEILRSDHEAGFVSDQTASIGRGYGEDEAEKARQDHADRLARIKEAQQSLVESNPGARGDKDNDLDPGNSGHQEKATSQNSHTQETGMKPVRGKEK